MRDFKYFHFCCLLFGCVLLVLLSLPTFAQEEEQTKQFELANGLKVFLYERHSIPLINLAFAVNCGSKDETENTNGIVHILEHYIMFRGTMFRSGDEVAQAIRENGAYFNAHTSRDLAYFEMTLPSENGDFGLKLQKEILFNLKLTQEELDDEKEIILEEINKIQDDPMRFATVLAYQNLFAGHPYQNPIYGNKDAIKSLTVGQVQEFYSRFFVPKRSSLVVLGDFDLPVMEEKVRDLYRDLTNENENIVAAEFESVSSLSELVRIEKEMDVNLGYLVIGMLGPDYNSPDQYSIDLLSEILGRGVNPLLYKPLSQRRLYANSLSLSYAANLYGGAIFVSLSLDPKNIKIAEMEIIKYLKSVRKESFSKDDYVGENQFYAMDYLENAKNQIKFRAHESQEDGLSLALSLARHLLLDNSSEGIDYLENIEKLTSSDLRKSGGRYLGGGRYVIVSIIPPGK